MFFFWLFMVLITFFSCFLHVVFSGFQRLFMVLITFFFMFFMLFFSGFQRFFMSGFELLS